jgi:pyruvate kinase
MTKIITTIGPASSSQQTLKYFAEHGVEYARLNFSHNIADWHREIGLLAREQGLKLMFDLAGPKVLLGGLTENVTINSGDQVVIEYQMESKSYPHQVELNGKSATVLPCQFEIHEFAQVGKDVLVDDGKLHLVVKEVHGNQVICDILFGGLVKSNKGLNLPGTDLNLDFLVKRDRELISALLVDLKPEMVAPSFVKTKQDLATVKEFMQGILDEAGVNDYFPGICTKIEMGEAVMNPNFAEILDESDLIMIARGDLALETTPANVMVPFYQTKIAELCKAKGVPFIVATQILETMFSSPVPTRAEVSDLYRAVVLNQADYVMLSGESAAGQFAEKCVELMYTMITKQDELQSAVDKALS